MCGIWAHYAKFGLGKSCEKGPGGLEKRRVWLIFVREQPSVAPDTKMKLDQKLLAQIEADLGLNVPFVKGQKIKIKNCWHFSTDGNAVDSDRFRLNERTVVVLKTKKEQ